MIGNITQALSLLKYSRNNPGLLTGTPNIVVRNAALNVFHKTVESTNFAHGNGILASQLEAWWRQVEKVLGSQIGNSVVLDKGDWLVYMRTMVELHSLSQCLYSMKLIVDMEWEAVFGEPKPFEFTNIIDRLHLTDQEFEAGYGHYLKRISRLPFPPMLLETIADFHSPFTMNTRDNCVYLNVVDKGVFLPLDEAEGYTALTDEGDPLGLFPAALAVVEQTHATVVSILSNWIPWTPTQVYPQLDHLDRVKILGWKNAIATSADVTDVGSTDTVGTVATKMEKDISDDLVYTNNSSIADLVNDALIPLSTDAAGFYKFACADPTPLTPMDLVYCSFHQRAGASSGGSFTSTNLGLAIYGDFGTMDESGDPIDCTAMNTIFVNSGGYTGATGWADDTIVEHQLYEFLTDDLAFAQPNGTGVSISIVSAAIADFVFTLSSDEREQLVYRNAVEEHLLPGIVPLLLGDLTALEEMTRLSGPRTARHDVKELK
jgi:hypothetical protein